MQFTNFYTETFGFGPGSNVSIHFKPWYPWDDPEANDNFIGSTLVNYTRLFNYYQLVSVDYTFAISGMYYNVSKALGCCTGLSPDPPVAPAFDCGATAIVFLD